MAMDARSNAWWTAMAKQYHPQEAEKLQQAMIANRLQLYSRCEQLPDAAEVVPILVALSKQEIAFGYYNGFRNGYKVGQGLAKLAKSSPRHRAEAFIIDLCLRHPNLTIKLIFAALDDEGIPLVFHGGVKKKAPIYWSDVVRDPAYMMFVSRLKEKMGQELRLKGWEKIMKRHTKLRKPQNPV